jgi:hypothetical protein
MEAEQNFKQSITWALINKERRQHIPLKVMFSSLVAFCGGGSVNHQTSPEYSEQIFVRSIILKFVKEYNWSHNDIVDAYEIARSKIRQIAIEQKAVYSV